MEHFVFVYHHSADAALMMCCCRHRHLPKPIYKAGKIRRAMIDAESRKEERRRAHSAPGSRTMQPFRKRRLITEVE
uniref:Sof1-like protein domain-containing protein n=1 Tax=Aegilops tauschii subsp. strangulata TaxID=200361 RepID=A0A453EJS9_AEGTS